MKEEGLIYKTEDASQPLLYHGAKNVKNDQKLKSSGGPALRQDTLDFSFLSSVNFFGTMVQKK